MEEARRALTLDPLSTSAMTHIGLALFRARRYDESVAELQRALEFDPNAIDAHLFLGFVYAQQGKSEATVIEFQTVAELSGRNESFLPLLGYAYAVAGKRGEAEAILKEISRTSRSGSGSPFGIALIYIGLREFDVAFEWLGKALNERAWQLGFLKVDPFYDPIRSDPRYLELVRHLALP